MWLCILKLHFSCAQLFFSPMLTIPFRPSYFSIDWEQTLYLFAFLFPHFFFPFKCSQSCWCILAESLKLMPFLKLNMSPDVCPPCCFHTAGCLQCSFWEQCRGWKWHTSLASLRIHSYSHKTHECCNFNDGFCSWLGRNQAQGCPRWEEALLMPPCEKHFGSFPDFWE